MAGGGNYGNSKATVFFDNLYFYSDVTSLDESNTRNEMKVRSADGLLMIDGVENQPVAVYSISGKCMYTTDKAAGRLQVADCFAGRYVYGKIDRSDGKNYGSLKKNSTCRNYSDRYLSKFFINI